MSLRTPPGPFDRISGKLTFEACDGAGREFVVEADVTDFTISTEADYSEAWSHDYSSASRIYLDRQEITLSAKVVDTYTVKQKAETISVDRTARIQATDRTPEAVEKAARLAGVPKSTKFRFHFRDELVEQDLDKPQPVQVEFVWKEEVPND